MVRTQLLRAYYRALEVFGEWTADAIRKHIPKETIQELLTPNHPGWMPLEADIQICEAVWRVTGDQGAYTWTKEGMNISHLSTVLTPLISGLLRVFRVKPDLMVKLGPQSWRALFRNVGELSVKMTAGNGATITIESVPEEVVRIDFFWICIGASIVAALEMTGRTITISQPKISVKGRTVAFSITWD